MNISDYLPDFTRYMQDERQLEPETVRNYLSDLKQVDEFVKKPVGKIEIDDLRAFVRDNITKPSDKLRCPGKQ